MTRAAQIMTILRSFVISSLGMAIFQAKCEIHQTVFRRVLLHFQGSLKAKKEENTGLLENNFWPCLCFEEDLDTADLIINGNGSIHANEQIQKGLTNLLEKVQE
jgi:hypothetical protein